MNALPEILMLAVLGFQDPPLFEDWSERTGIKGIEGARVAFADLDGDGRPDAVIEATRILLNREGKWLRRAADAEFLVTPGGRRPQAVQFGDVNNDGKLDLAFCFMADLKNPEFKDDGRRNEIWIGDGKGGFMPAKDSGIGAQGEMSVTACFFDYDRDGILDLFVGNWYERPFKAPEGYPSRLFRGPGNGAFQDGTAKAGLTGCADRVQPE